MFDELGVDHIFIDEAHYFKNLETPTKMERVAGIQTGGSERAFDLYMKARYLDQQHPGHGVTFATGTPISNTMVEMYTMQRFLDPEGLQEPRHRAFRRLGRHLRRGRRHDGNLPRRQDAASRAAASPASPTCPNSSRCSAPSPTCRRPRCSTCPGPELESGKPIVVACPMSDEQHALQQELVARYDRLRSQKVDPREDNALAITTDGRKLALDARMLSPTAPDFPGSKVNALVENVAAIWQRTAADARHADDLLRHGRPPDALGLLGLRRDHRASWSPAASPASRSPPSATPTPTPRNRPCSRRSAAARCAC